MLISFREENWEEKLHELFDDNCDDDDENPLDKSLHFLQLTPRSKIKVLLKLCELRLDVEGAFEEIKVVKILYIIFEMKQFFNKVLFFSGILL